MLVWNDCNGIVEVVCDIGIENRVCMKFNIWVGMV